MFKIKICVNNISMKKMILISISIFLLIASYCMNTQNTTKLLFKSGDTYTFYVGSQSSNAQIITSSKVDALTYKQNLEVICGESTVYDSIDEAEKIIKTYDANFVLKEKCTNTCSYYFYSKNLHNFVLINGVKVNLHIAINFSLNEKMVAVGSPLIFGGF